MTTDNGTLTRQLHDAFSANDFEQCLAMAAPDVQIIAQAFGLTFNGREEFRQFMLGFKQAFPDMLIRHDNIVDNGNRVAVQFTATGTHTGPLQTPAGAVPPSGNTVELQVAEFLEWQDSQLVRLTNYQDAGALLRQLGVGG